jgi:hypothetical protein
MYIWDLDMGPGLQPPMAPPGKYTVELKIGDKTYKQKVEVLKDPSTKGGADDIQKQYMFTMKLYNAVKDCFVMIDEMETMRAQLLHMIDSSGSSTAKKLQAAKLENDLWTLEGRIHDVFQTGAREDNFRNPAKLLERFLAIQKEAAVGSADFQPTNQDVEVYNNLKSDLEKVKNDYAVVKKNLEPVKKDIIIKSKVDTKKNKQ